MLIIVTRNRDILLKQHPELGKMNNRGEKEKLMKENRLPVITINREYGAGGRSLAEILSDKLGIPYYDREFVSKTVEESGYDVEDVEREGEEMSRPSKVLNNILNSTVSYSSSHDAIFSAEKKVILELADKPCIMVGRCADYILGQAGIDTVSVFLHAPIENRMERLKQREGETGELSEKFVEERDKQRKTFYKQYTGREIFDAANYTFSFDVSRIDISDCADIILDLLKKSEKDN